MLKIFNLLRLYQVPTILEHECSNGDSNSEGESEDEYTGNDSTQYEDENNITNAVSELSKKVYFLYLRYTASLFLTCLVYAMSALWLT